MTEYNEGILEIIKNTCSKCIDEYGREPYDFTNSFNNIIIAKEIDKNKVIDGNFDCCGHIIFIEEYVQYIDNFSLTDTDTDGDSHSEEIHNQEYLNTYDVSDQNYLNTIDVSFYYTYDIDEGTGCVDIWFPNKSKLGKINFLNYKLHGLYEEWHSVSNPENSELVSQIYIKCEYLNGKEHGLREEWFCDGQRKLKCSYDNGEQNNDLEEWYKNGQRSVLHQTINETDDDNDDDVQTYEEWTENGIRTVFVNYVNDKHHGIYETRHDNGNLHVLCTYVNDQKHGLYQSWHENNVKHRTCNFNNGIIEGILEEWFDNGSLHTKCNYNDGGCEILESYDIDGNPVGVEDPYYYNNYHVLI